MRVGERRLSLSSRLIGGTLVLAATGLVAIVESFLVPLRLGSVRLPVSLAFAVVLHPALTWLMRAATGSAKLLIAPFALWLPLVFALGLQRAEGDLVLTSGNWVASALLPAGSLLFVATIGVLLPAGRRTAGNLGSNEPA